MAKFAVGDSVVHKMFGDGDILDIEGFGDNLKLTIAFSDDEKTIMSKYVKLVKK